MLSSEGEDGRSNSAWIFLRLMPLPLLVVTDDAPFGRCMWVAVVLSLLFRFMDDDTPPWMRITVSIPVPPRTPALSLVTVTMGEEATMMDDSTQTDGINQTLRDCSYITLLMRCQFAGVLRFALK